MLYKIYYMKYNDRNILYEKNGLDKKIVKSIKN